MASLIWDGEPKGPRGWRRARIQFLMSDRRLTVRLGATSEKVAREWQARIESLVVDLRGGVSHDGPLVAWLQNLPDEAYGKLARVGLVAPRVREEASRRTLEDLIVAFASRATVKAGTAINYGQTFDSLRLFYGSDRLLSTITAETADEWRKAISTATTGEGRRKKRRMRADGRLAPATVSKRVRVGKQLFSKAVSWGWIESNPFQGLTAGSQANPARSAYVDVPTADAVLEACPGPEWRVLVGLTRFAGLRCPSEVGGLTWGDVDFHHGRLTVRSPKTEHHGHDHAVRFVPISPRLRAILMDAFDAAAAGETLVVPMAKGGANLRTGFERIIIRASCQPWPRLFQNLRASCETDWATQHPAHAVAKWLGHSPRIAQAHYLVTTEAHFWSVIEADEGPAVRGAKCGAVVVQNAAQQASATGTQRIARREKTVVIPVEHAISPVVDENRENSLVGPV
jgi:integrase